MSYQLSSAKVWDGTQWVAATGGGPSYPDLPVTANLHAHFDAAQIDLTDGVALAQWDDVSGNARHATQATGAAQPTYRTSPGGGTYVKFDGVDDFLETAAWTAVSQPNDLFIVGRVGVPSGTEVMVDGLDGSNRHQFAAVSGAWRLTAGTSLSGGTADNVPHIFALRFDGASSAIRVDGAAVTSGNAGTHAVTGLSLGRIGGLAAGYLSGYLAEVLLYSSALGTTDRDAVEAYLAEKWGL